MDSREQQLSLMLLPFELVEEIFHRIPIKSVVRFKSVSKEWYALLNEKRFIYNHLDLSKEQFMLVDHKSIHFFSLEGKALLCLPKPDELHNYKIAKPINCDGLLLCKCFERGRRRSDDASRKLAVWNPILRRVKWIEPSSSYKIRDVYGFGYDNVSRDNYKILRISDKTLEGKSLEVEIYEFKSNLWRSVNATLESEPPLRYVSMSGNIYWVSQKEMVESKREIIIQSFDFSAETFKPICCVPNGICVSSDGRAVLSGCGGDRLSLIHQHNNVKFDVWVTSKLNDGNVSWSNYFNVSLHDPSIVSSSFHRIYPKTFILKTNKIMLCCEVSRNYYTHDSTVYELSDKGELKNHVEMTRARRRLDGIFDNVYVPSLVPVPEEDIKRDL